MKSRYQCPKCGGGLSYTALAPRWWIYEAQFPPLPIPLSRIIFAIILIGFGLAFIHPLLSLLALVGIGSWAGLRYFYPLQCDECASYFITGQFGRTDSRVPQTWGSLTRHALLATAIVVGLFTAIQLAQTWYSSKCSENCEIAGLRMQSTKRLFDCTCTMQPT